MSLFNISNMVTVAHILDCCKETFRQSLLEIKDLTEFKKLDKNLVYEMDRVRARPLMFDVAILSF